MQKLGENEMKKLNRHSGKSLLGLCLVLAITLVLALPASGYSAGKAGYVRQAREIETADLGIVNPAGLVFSPAANTFHVLEAASLGQPDSLSADMKGLTLNIEPTGSIRVQADVADPVNIAFDSNFDRLLILTSSDLKSAAFPSGSGGRLKADIQSSYDIKSWGLEKPSGLAVDPDSGKVFILDQFPLSLVSVVPAADGGFDVAVISEIDLALLGLDDPHGLALDPLSGNLFILDRADRTLYEMTQSGSIVATRDLSSFWLRDPQAMVVAPSGDLTDNPRQTSLYLADSGQVSKVSSGKTIVYDKKAAEGRIVELSFDEPVATAASNFVSTLIRNIDTSKFSPPSPDPAGLEYITSSNRLLISDSEVEEMTIWAGANLFETTLDGRLMRTASTYAYSREPTGLAYNPVNQHLFQSDDNQTQIYEMDPGGDGLYGTADDIITSFDTASFYCNDPEGLAFDAVTGSLFIADGVNSEIYRVRPGANGRFDGYDDQVTNFDTAILGVNDPEGIAFNKNTGHIYIVGSPRTYVAELTITGELVQMIDISAANPKKPAGMAIGPSSVNNAVITMYICDRVYDNGYDPNENDGKAYEMSLPPSTPANTAPAVNISSPAGGSAYTYGEAVTFSGSAVDAEDGSLSGSLVWTSSRDGQIGTGSTFTRSDLSAGTHTITASVTDSGGLAGSAQVIITVTAPANTAPAVNISSPAGGSAYTYGEAVTFSGSAVDAEDGSLSGSLVWTSSRDGQIGTGSTFTRSDLSAGTHTITASVTDSGGLAGSAQVTITVAEAAAGSNQFNASDDAYVNSALPTAKYGLSAYLKLYANSTETRRSYLKFPLSGLSSTITSAKIRLYSAATSTSGGSAYLVSNNYKGTATPWVESGLSWNNAPELSGESLSSVGAVNVKTWVEFDVTAAVKGNGVYSFALVNLTPSVTIYKSGESVANNPVLLVETGTNTVTALNISSPVNQAIFVYEEEPANTAPAVNISSPAGGSAYTYGEAVTFSGSAVDAEDGSLSGSLVWTSSRDGQIGTGSTFTRSDLSAGTHTITASVTDSGGLAGSAQVTITVAEAAAGSNQFNASDDAYVNSAKPKANHGSTKSLR
jgi:uncharacterized protein YjiK